MIKKSYRTLILFLSVLTVSLAFIGGDCGTDSDDPEAPGAVAPPTNVDLLVSAVAGGGSFAVVSWSHSADINRTEFSHYRVVTYQVDTSGNATSIFNTQENISKNTAVYTVNSISRGTRYRSFVQAVLTDGTRSDSVGTRIYGGVYIREGAEIDELSSSNEAESGYGWDPNTGQGTQYSYVAGNFNNIDLHLRADNAGNFLFHSPASQGGTKTTLIGLVGGGQTNWDKTSLNEPTQTSIQIGEDIVYLLKTQEGNYIKVWVKDINDPLVGFATVTFDYKVQPIENLRVVKR